jgi:beta-N-acetylhexosaminidase
MNLGSIMMDVSGLTLTNLEKQQLAKASIGGVILFSRNFKDIYQVKSLIQSIRLTNQNLLIAVDHEGGRVQRFREGFTHLPAMAKLGEIYDQNPDHALEQAASCGYVLAAEIK